MNRMSKLAAALLSAALLAWAPAWAGPQEDVIRLQQAWEQIKYQTPADAQERQFERLLEEARQSAAQPGANADVLVWFAIIESTYAGAKGGMGALSHVKSAKKSLEQAIALNPGALAGSAYTSLGSLYYQVPGWPIGFGDDQKALEYLKRGLALNPDGIDPNYFLGDYLFRKGEYDQAERALHKAMLAAPRHGRKLADEGRRGEIQQLLDKIAAKRK